MLLDGLPSTSDSGQQFADLAGLSAAAMAPDGTVCTVIGDAGGDAHGTMRCSDGLTVGLKDFERDANPDGDEIASNRYDIAADGDHGWYVTDAAANAVLHIERGGGEIEVVASFRSLEPITGEATDAVPTGILRRDDDLIVALFGGAVVRIGRNGEGDVLGEVPSPIALAEVEDGAILVLSHEDGTVIRLDDGHEPELIVADLDRPTGLARAEGSSHLIPPLSEHWEQSEADKGANKGASVSDGNAEIWQVEHAFGRRTSVGTAYRMRGIPMSCVPIWVD